MDTVEAFYIMWKYLTGFMPEHVLHSWSLEKIEEFTEKQSPGSTLWNLNYIKISEPLGLDSEFLSAYPVAEFKDPCGSALI